MLKINRWEIIIFDLPPYFTFVAKKYGRSNMADMTASYKAKEL